MSKQPILIEMTEETAPMVTEAPPITDEPTLEDQSTTLQRLASAGARVPSRLMRLFWWLVFALFAAVLSISLWAFLTDLMVRFPLIGLAVVGLVCAVLLVLGIIAVRELSVFARLARIDALNHEATAALSDNDLARARAVCDRLIHLYGRREDIRWGRKRFAELCHDQLDAQALLGVAEKELLSPLDKVALGEVQSAARRVATVTALVPLAFIDVLSALAANLRMIRRIAEIYGGRSGFFGSWRLVRAVLSHLVATGAVALGDELLEPFLGGTVLAKISRRFGEGLVNGALTVRVGLAAMEVCRPLPFGRQARPKLRDVLRQSLSGLWRSDGVA
ncbi:MAG: TIGR01620 family protein [Pseudomonadota bacterium]